MMNPSHRSGEKGKGVEIGNIYVKHMGGNQLRYRHTVQIETIVRGNNYCSSADALEGNKCETGEEKKGEKM
jgi:hypothetical protein